MKAGQPNAEETVTPKNEVKPEDAAHDAAIFIASEFGLTDPQRWKVEEIITNQLAEPESVGRTRLIPLTQGKFAIVDAEDYECLAAVKWHAHKDGTNWYAWRRTGRKVLSMHRVLLGLTDPKIQVDHIDGNGLNNSRANLRRATSLQNQMNKRPLRNNKCGFKGVFWDKGKKRWMAFLMVNGDRKRLGRYREKEAAARAYDAAARKYFGEFARLNFPAEA